MKLKVLLPSQVLLEEPVSKVNGEAENGWFCLEPRHVDFCTSLVPGLLHFTSLAGAESFLAVDEGILVKCGAEVLVSVRNAVRGADLAALERVVMLEYRRLDEAERAARAAISRLEVGVARRLMELGAELR